MANYGHKTIFSGNLKIPFRRSTGRSFSVFACWHAELFQRLDVYGASFCSDAFCRDCDDD